MAVGFIIKDASDNVLISSESTTLLLHDSFIETSDGANSKTYSDIPIGSTIYTTCTWGLNSNAYNTYQDNQGFAGFIALYTGLLYSYSFTIAANGNYTLNYDCAVDNNYVSTSIYDMIDFHIKVYIK